MTGERHADADEHDERDGRSENSEGPPDKYRFLNPNSTFPQFYSFVPDEDDDDYPNELHYAVFGVNGPVEELRIYSDGTADRFKTSMWDVWMEDKAVGLDCVSWEESAWPEYYFNPREDDDQ